MPGRLVGFEPRHFQDFAQGVEAVAPRDFRKFSADRGDIMSCRFGRFSVRRTVAVVLVRHFLVAAQLAGGLPRRRGPFAMSLLTAQLWFFFPTSRLLLSYTRTLNLANKQLLDVFECTADSARLFHHLRLGL